MGRPKAEPAARRDTTEIKKAISRGEGGLDSGLLLNSILESWGGPARFAQDIFLEYQAAKTGGMTRQKILEMVSRLTIVVTNQEIARPRKPEDMSDLELASVAARLLERIPHEPDGPD